MSVDDSKRGGPWVTLTHARLRAAQGDVSGARRLLRVLLERRPGDADAASLQAQLERRKDASHAEPIEECVKPATPATAQDLTGRFRRTLAQDQPGPRQARIDRLERWLKRILKAETRDV